jgi:proteic killer suppression protein
MIKTFHRKGLEIFFRKGSKAGIQPHHAGKLRIMLTMLDSAKQPDDERARLEISPADWRSCRTLFRND